MYVHTRERDSRPGFVGVKIKLLLLLLLLLYNITVSLVYIEAIATADLYRRLVLLPNSLKSHFLNLLNHTLVHFIVCLDSGRVILLLRYPVL